MQEKHNSVITHYFLIKIASDKAEVVEVAILSNNIFTVDNMIMLMFMLTSKKLSLT